MRTEKVVKGSHQWRVLTQDGQRDLPEFSFIHKSNGDIETIKLELQE